MPIPTLPHWLIIVDEYTQLKRVEFFKSKSDIVEYLCEIINRDGNNGMPVRFVRCDNAGENKKFQDRAKSADWKLTIIFEFTPRCTPQHNSLAETGFATLMKRARAIMADANIPMNFRYRLYPEVIRTAAKLDSLAVINIRGIEKTRFQFYNNDEEPRWASKLRTWGEAGVVKLKDLATAKLEDRGRTCMFVGYAADHSADCYRMWDPLTSRLHVSRDVVWLRRMFFTKKVLGDDELVVVIPQVSDPGETCVTTGEGFDESDTDEESVEDIDGGEEESELEEHQDNRGIRREHKTTTRSGRKIYSPQRLIASALVRTTRAQRQSGKRFAKSIRAFTSKYLHRSDMRYQRDDGFKRFFSHA
jgi:hypothetical protein